MDCDMVFTAEFADASLYPRGQPVRTGQSDGLREDVHVSKQGRFLLREAIMIDLAVFLPLLGFVVHSKYTVDHVFFTEAVGFGTVLEGKGLAQTAIHDVIELVQDGNVACKPVVLLPN